MEVENLSKLRKYFNRKKFEELYINPPKKIYVENTKKSFSLDIRILRKILLAIEFMVENNQEILIGFSGKTGTGKSSMSSQIGYTFYYFLKELNLLQKEINHYEWNIENVMRARLSSFLQVVDKFSKYLFKINILDEGSDLSGENRWDEANQKFRENLNKYRKYSHITIINHPNIKALIKEFAIYKINFLITTYQNENLKDLGESKYLKAKPGKFEFVIFPVGTKNYSHITRRSYIGDELREEFAEIILKKKHSGIIPDKFIFLKSTFEKTFTFDDKEYEEMIDKENLDAEKETKIQISPKQAITLFKYLKLSKLGLTNKTEDEELKKDYETTNAFKKKLKKYVDSLTRKKEILEDIEKDIEEEENE